MNSSVTNYEKLYNLQDKVLKDILPYLDHFYLTGGTAISKFYLNHRYSDDLDFFIHHSSHFKSIGENIFKQLKKFYKIDHTVTVHSDDFMRIIIRSGENLKIELINDIAYRWGGTKKAGEIPVDNICNIMANKLTALLSRDEPKDVFDIVKIAENYQFNWIKMYHIALEKQLMNEQDIAMRLSGFPVEWMIEKNWLKREIDKKSFKNKLNIITDDFILGKNNSLGKDK
ncbi:MAG: nucleotidyl transferase AbiEii/AbiGii toxin family protein, partial [Flavobacteriales bacterium]